MFAYYNVNIHKENRLQSIFTVVYRYSVTLCNTGTLREESSQTNVILQYKLLAAILSAVYSVIQQS